MAASIFDLKTIEPDDLMLLTELGETKNYLDRMQLFILEEYGEQTKEWRYYGKKSGWVLKIFTRKRNVLFVIPCKGFFRVAITFGDKAVNKLMEYELPGFNKQELLDTKKYAEGRTIQFEVNTEQDYFTVLHLIQIKLNN